MTNNRLDKLEQMTKQLIDEMTQIPKQAVTREWVGLTGEDIKALSEKTSTEANWLILLIDNVQAKLKEKNT